MVATQALEVNHELIWRYDQLLSISLDKQLIGLLLVANM